MSTVSSPPVTTEGLLPCVPPTVCVPSLPHVDFKSILNKEVAAIHRPWDGTIMFSVCPYSAGVDSTPPVLTPAHFVCVDTCKYFSGRKCPVTHLYFDPVKYPSPPLVGLSVSSTGDDSLTDLKRDIKRSAFDSGFTLSTNGGGIGVTLLRCGAFRCRSESAEDHPNFCSTSLVANHKNRRQNGRAKSRRRHVRVKGVCPFRFNVKWDEHGYYVFLTNNFGNPRHQFHPQPFDPSTLPIPTSLLTEEEEQDTHHVTNSTCVTSGRNYVFSKFKQFLSRAKVAYLMSKDQGITKEDDITQMLDQFENSDQIKFSSITDVPTSEFRGHRGDFESASVVVSTSKQEDGEIVNLPVLDVPAMEPMEKAVKLSRRLQKIRDKQYQFIDIA